MAGDSLLSSIKNKVSSKLQKNKKKHSKKNGTDKQVKDTTDNESYGDRQDLLRCEALSLGATEKDLELIGNLDDDDEASEQEFGDAGAAEEDEKFGNELQSFLQNLGLNKESAERFAVEADDEEIVDKETERVEHQDQETLSSDPKSEDTAEKEAESDAEFNVEEKENKEGVKEDSGFVTQSDMVNSDKLLIPFETVWYNIPLDPQIAQNLKEKDAPLTKEQIDRLYERGKESLLADNQIYYDELTKESSQRKFMTQVLSSGTLNDKISALTLLMQESPIHNIKCLETLMTFCSKKSRNSILQSLNALKDLFLNGLLPDRKLRYFKNQPGLSMMLNKKTLAIFYFEDLLKRTYFKILEVLEKLSHDPIIHVRLQCLNHIFDLLTSKPEQEFNLLRLGVNKLGDIDSKVSSKASYLLLKLEQAHPNMKSILIDAIVDTCLRPNVDYHTTYYSVITLNQTILRRSEDDIANKLIKTYFTLFEKFLVDSDSQHDNDAVQSSNKSYETKRKKNFKKGKKGGKSVKNEKTEADIVSEKNSKLFNALLTGVNRAFPFARVPASVYEAHLETLFKITHSSNFNTSVQALVLINQVVVKAELNSDRYYRTLYESLLDSRLVTSSKQGIYLNLLYKSLKQDAANVERVEAFVKRILQVCSHWLNVGTIAGFLYLLLQLVQAVPQIKNLLTNTPVDHEYQSESEEDEASKPKNRKYDSRKRDPKFANADQSSLWEIIQFTDHYHPTVQMYAQAFLQNKKDEVVKPDLGLYTLAHFLDRFVYRNAKQKPTVRGSSIMQPLYGGSQIDQGLLVKSSDYAANQVPANTQNWLNKKVQDIKPDEMFFYQYFTTKQSAIKTKKDEGRLDENSDGEMNEDEVWNALVKSRPDVEDDSEDDDIGFDDEDFDSISESEGDDVPEQESDDDSSAEEENEQLEQRKREENDGEESDDDDVFYSFLDDEVKEEGIDENSAQEDEDAEQQEDGSKKRPHSSSAKNNKKSKKRKLKDLPLYASVDDYRKLLDSDAE
ncbi:hypothetical protein HG536_0D04170 [Torulaspora globosa]|uniref:CCAAT-binding factor domain-containing protein n=1 Tax=Torulaspora globosa TaxID=48254 RepID=A0A7G3ZHA9_9SACH|nr:uncharacterized protein HG536_0D04170 [Torulaspora globosa]QLL32895.1 hypothetical protein HG536_0D04170 [Torulaspora globosa]